MKNIYHQQIFFDFDLIKDCFLEENEYLIKDYPYLKNGIYLLEALLTIGCMRRFALTNFNINH